MLRVYFSSLAVRHVNALDLYRVRISDTRRVHLLRPINVFYFSLFFLPCTFVSAIDTLARQFGVRVVGGRLGVIIHVGVSILYRFVDISHLATLLA